MTAARILTILELLQTHGRLNGADLAERTGIDRRTVRRYIAMLEEMGVPLTASRGPHGGYELVAGFKLPPMMFTNEEALAVGLGLAAVRGLGLAGGSHAIAGAAAKLERVMPAGLKERVRSVSESIAFAPPGRGESANSESLARLSAAAHSRRGVRLRYRAANDEESERDFDPYGIALRGGRWYAAGFCHLRGGLRSFRLDRILAVEVQTRRFDRPAGFDIVSHLSTGIALLPRQHGVEVLLHTDLDSARREIFQAIGVLEAAGGKVRMHSQVDDLDWFARELSRLPWRFEVVRPRALIAAVRKHARRLLARHRLP